MGLLDFLNATDYKKQILELQEANELASVHIGELETKNKQIEKMITPEMQNVINLQNEASRISAEMIKQQHKITSLKSTETQLDFSIKCKKESIIELEEKVLMQSFGLYEPKYDFVASDIYKAELEKIRDKQKQMIKDKVAVTGNTSWSVNNSAVEGKKMVTDMQKLLLRAFNGECEEIIGRVKYNNFEASKKRITTSFEAISKLGNMMSIAITTRYFNLKIQELELALEYQLKKQKEKEEQKAIKDQMREEAKLQKEIEESRKKIVKEQTHYENALAKINQQIENSTEEQKEELLKKKQEIESELTNIEKSISDIDFRQANSRAGYVYIISNIGAFGENIYKIGMTRRLDPMDRVDELGDASVPFDFDVHAMIFSDDAPGLENSLHKAFENKKLNFVNLRREFFNVTLSEIKEVINKNYDKTVEFIDVPNADQYRISLKMRENTK